MDILIWIMVGLFGLIIGSFLNCLIWRWHQEESLGGRSYCPNCRKKIRWFDNIPVLSFFLLRGKCRDCHQSISWQYPLVELATASLFMIMFGRDLPYANFAWLLARDWLLVCVLIIIFVYDFRWQLVPVNVVWVFMAIIFVFNLFLGAPWWQLIIAAAVAASFFLAQYILTKKRGVGEGDIWLGAMIGIIFPTLSQLMLILVIAYGCGAIVSLILLAVKKKKWKSQIALGPFLVIGAIITLIWGQDIIYWYMSLFS